MNTKCIFCQRDDTTLNRIIAENELAYARWDNLPVSKGHLEVNPKRHIESVFELTENEMSAIYELMKIAKGIVEAEYAPNGYHIAVNEGEASGKTVPHLHFHLIPRYTGDKADPRGGIVTSLFGN